YSFIVFVFFFSVIPFTNASFPYFGTKIGSLKRLHHGVSGDVYAVDSRTIFVKKFNYDGEAPAAYFYVGNTNKPSNEGAYRLRDERGGAAALTRRYRNKDITLSLPEGISLKDIKWFSVWCDEFAVNFGDVTIPSNLDFPRPQKINNLNGVHDVKSDNIVIVDAQTLLVPNFSYDGEAPDAKFWVGQGDRPSPNGLRIPDENGKEDPLRRYDRKTIVLTLPDDLTIFDIGHFGVWCEAFTVDFGHVRIPKNLNVPPSLKMLGISPQSKLNCEVLYDDKAFEVRWAMAGDSIVVQMVAKLDDNEYMAFGISPDKDRSVMIGSDVAVSWVDRATGKGYAIDYYLEGKSQCSGKRGSCPDVNIDDNTNSIRLLNAAMVNGYSIVTYQRSLNATDRLDLPIARNGFEAIVWGIGPLNERKETSFHSHFNKRTHYIDFGRQPTWNCPTPEGQKPDQDEDDDDDEDQVQKNQQPGKGYPPASKPSRGDGVPEEEYYDNNRAQALQGGNRRQETTNTRLAQRRPVPTPKPVVNENGAWDIPAIQCYEPEDGVFYAQMGPTGGKHGYSAITGHVGWGISWFINGLLIPEIHVVRGKTYTFVVEGGNNPDVPAKYHPFYITDDPIGGYEHKREEEKKNIRIFAGVHRSRSGQITPTGVGRLCNWTPDIDGPPADDYQSFGAYQRTLTLKCDPGEPGVITWKPDQNTPDTVYYHCFTHRYLGWKIHVHDTCDDARFAASETHAVRVPAPVAVQEEDDVAAEASLRHETKVSPNDNFLLKHQTDLIKNHNMNGTPPKLTFEITKSTEITKLISDGIRAAEALEDSILRQKQQQQQHQQASGLVNQGLANNYIVNSNSNLNTNSANVSPSLGTSASSPSSSIHDASKTSQAGSSHPLVPPQQPQISTNPPETLHGETNLQQFLDSLQSTSSLSQSLSLPHSNNRQSPVLLATHLQSHLNTPYNNNNNHYHLTQPHHHTANNLTNNLPLKNSQKPIGLSEYLRPPFNAPLFHPVKLPGRRPYPGPIKKVPASKPILPQQLPRHPPGLGGPVPQPSVIVNHYRKPVPTLLRPFIKDKPFPLQPLAASVLLLGQPTELTNTRKTDNLVHMLKKPIIPVPYSDLMPQGSLTKPIFNNNNKNSLDKLKNKPISPIKIAVDNIKTHETSTTTVKTTNGLSHVGVFKEPFVMQEIKEEPTAAELATMKPAVNEGFKPDTVVVESGFKPILRQDGPMPPPEVVEQIASRREDPGLEIDEAMETDTLFLTSQQQTQTQNFEPMFIPSPPDSTNATIIIRKTSDALNMYNTPVAQSMALPQSNKDFVYNKPISSMLKSTLNLPEAAKLRNASLEDILNESTEQDDIKNVDYKEENVQNNLEESTTQKPLNTKQNNVVIKEIEDMYPSDEYIDMEGFQSQTKLKLIATTTTKEEPKIKSTTPAEVVLKLSKINKSDKSNLDDIEFDSDDSRDVGEHNDNNNEREDDDDEYLFDLDQPEAQAAERIDTYYLPPDNRKIPHSNIPSGSVITFDGKSVIDSSLVLPPKLDTERDDTSSPRLFNGNGRQGLSKLQQLIRSTPQVVPFRGEIPPLTPDLSPDTTQRSLQSNNKFNTYSSSSSSSLRSSQSTKLQIIKNNSN
ncbi:isoforms D/E, Protein Skeletor, partial [Lucilia cuprina]